MPGSVNPARPRVVTCGQLRVEPDGDPGQQRVDGRIDRPQRAGNAHEAVQWGWVGMMLPQAGILQDQLQGQRRHVVPGHLPDRRDLRQAVGSVVKGGKVRIRFPLIV